MRRKVLLLVFVLLLSSSVNAFKTYWLVGGDVHEDITNLALAGQIDAWYLEMVDAGNTAQDLDNLWDSNAHFDNMAIRGSLGYIGARWREALNLVEKQSYGSGCRQFGRLIHTIQDFYSHSNYVELHLKRGVLPSNIAPANWKALPPGIKTGYFHDREFVSSNRAYLLKGVENALGAHPRFHLSSEYEAVYKNESLSPAELYHGAVNYVTDGHDILHLAVNKDNAATGQGRVVHPASGKTLHAIARSVAMADTRRTWDRFLADVARLPDGKKHVQALTGREEPLTSAGEFLFPEEPEPGPPGGRSRSGPPPGPNDPPPTDVLPQPKEDPPRTTAVTPPRPPVEPEAPPDEPPDEPPEELPEEPKGSALQVQVLAPDRVEAGNSVQLTSLVKGGRAPYTYSWTAPGVTGQDERLMVPFNEPGSQSVALVVTDDQGLVGRASARIEVTSGGNSPVASDLQIQLLAPDRVRAGRALTLTSSVKGGLPPYTYLWETAGKTWPSESLTLDYDVPGIHSVRLTVSDRGGQVRTASANITVEDSLSVNIDGPRRVGVGDKVTYTPVVVNGPRGGHTYSWEFEGQSGSGGAFTPTFADQGRKTLILSIRTAGQPVYRVKAFIEVESGSVAAQPLRATIEGPSQARVGEQVTFRAVTSGGQGALRYRWRVKGASVAERGIRGSFERPGSYPVVLEVSDENKTVRASTTIVITQPMANARPRRTTPPPPPPPPRPRTPSGIGMAEFAGTYEISLAGTLLDNPSTWQFTSDGRAAQYSGERLGRAQSYRLENGQMTWNGKSGRLTRTSSPDTLSFMYRSGNGWRELFFKRTNGPRRQSPGFYKPTDIPGNH